MVFLVRLHVGRQGSCRVVPSGTGRALIRFLRVVRFHMDLQMVAPGESSLAVRASISSVSCVKLHVSISAAFMFEQSGTPAAPVWHLVPVTLFVLLEIAKPGERAVAELAGVRGCRVAPVGVHSDVGVDLWLRRETGRRRGRARRGRLAASPRVWSAILALPRRASGPQRLFGLLLLLLRRLLVCLDFPY